VVAEQFGKTTSSRPPRSSPPVPAAASSCSAPASASSIPDITNASRAHQKIRVSTKCQANGVKEIVEVKIGYDGIVVANSKKAAR
jgi:phosphate transport system substrate-binding protein